MNDLSYAFGTGVSRRSVTGLSGESERLFVRSEGQLAVYEESRKPTGHVLTRWEAVDAYGSAMLEEAVEYGSAILKRTKNSTARALTRQREALGLTLGSLARAAMLDESSVREAERSPSSVPIEDLERLAFTLGLDERLLGFKDDSGGDPALAYRLRTLWKGEGGPSGSISERTALLFAEAASVIRAQLRLHRWLDLPMGSDQFKPSEDYGSPMQPAWRVGYDLAERARIALGIGLAPIDSMRVLVEERLGIPVIQAELSPSIAGATVVTRDAQGGESRGVVLNTRGENQNVWVRRATLGHELGHLLFDTDAELKSVRVDSYAESQGDPHTQGTDYVEQRANAFAIALLAPNESVRSLAPTPVSEESVARVMRAFGISHTAARYHIANAHHRQFDVPSDVHDAAPSDEQKAAEDFTVDYFPLPDTPRQRRGRFAALVAKSYDRGLISEDTSTRYLQCTPEALRENIGQIRTIYALETP